MDIIENNKQETGLTIDKLRKFPGCEHYTDEEAEQVVNSLNSLAEILLEYPLEKLYYIDNQLVVSLGGQNKKAA